MTYYDGLAGTFTGTLGETVTVTPVVGDAFAVEGIFRRRPNIDFGGGPGSASYETTLSVSLDDGLLIEDGDAVNVGGTIYIARTQQSDGRAMAQIMLELA